MLEEYSAWALWPCLRCLCSDKPVRRLPCSSSTWHTSTPTMCGKVPSAIGFSLPTGNSVVCFLGFLKISYHQFNYTTTRAFAIPSWRPLPQCNTLLFLSWGKRDQISLQVQSAKAHFSVLPPGDSGQCASPDMPTHCASHQNSNLFSFA